MIFLHSCLHFTHGNYKEEKRNTRFCHRNYVLLLNGWFSLHVKHRCTSIQVLDNDILNWVCIAYTSLTHSLSRYASIAVCLYINTFRGLTNSIILLFFLVSWCNRCCNGHHNLARYKEAQYKRECYLYLMVNVTYKFKFLCIFKKKINTKKNNSDMLKNRRLKTTKSCSTI